ncbi:hypothetical protein M2271_007491 [Streptomyces sp. LBL]|uniref:hypothetical protein n=1 Tax=Streptomyces sp. LBL TaxID=2940562 RepID=UPI002473DDBA|nr:hypothetical protein [Streptomyces sp. LBL]MDH6629653.1 hypothetical protein [Streptomyces sp. LBL]
MRSPRMLLAAAAASAVLAVTAPGAYAAGDWDHDDSSYSKEHDKGGSHDSPHGGMHTGGGALTAVSDGGSDSGYSSKQDPEASKDSEQGKDSTWTKDSEDSGAKASESSGAKDSESSWTKDSEDSETKGGEGSGSGGHKKPSGGIHTGGGALATPGVTTGGLAALAVVGTGLYAARRKKSAYSAA